MSWQRKRVTSEAMRILLRSSRSAHTPAGRASTAKGRNCATDTIATSPTLPPTASTANGSDDHHHPVAEDRQHLAGEQQAVLRLLAQHGRKPRASGARWFRRYLVAAHGGRSLSEPGVPPTRVSASTVQRSISRAGRGVTCAATGASSRGRVRGPPAPRRAGRGSRALGEADRHRRRRAARRADRGRGRRAAVVPHPSNAAGVVAQTVAARSTSRAATCPPISSSLRTSLLRVRSSASSPPRSTTRTAA